MVETTIISMLVIFFVLSFFFKDKNKNRIRFLLFFTIFIVFFTSAFLTDRLYINLIFAFFALIQLINEMKKLIVAN